MEVLIIGEYSAFAKNLCAGINATPNNHAVVFAFKDGFKNISQSKDSHTYEYPQFKRIFNIPIPFSNKIRGVLLYRKFKEDIKKYKEFFDVIFIINSSFLRDKSCKTMPLFSLEDISFVSKENAKIFLSACGGDSVYYQFATTDPRISTTFNKKNCRVPNRVAALEKNVFKVVNGIIPMSYQYAQAYRTYASHLRILPSVHLPFDISTVGKRNGYCKEGKIIIFNAALRPKKGMSFINKALDIIEERYKDKVVIRNDRLPYAEYLKFLLEVDLFIDLCVDYDYGMSAISAMAAGCVVFSGNEKETQKELGIDDVPVVGISPDVQLIVDKVSFFIDNPKQIRIVGQKSVNYVQKNHSCDVIAAKYLEHFNS